MQRQVGSKSPLSATRVKNQTKMLKNNDLPYHGYFAFVKRFLQLVERGLLVQGVFAL